jgi:hypothetical protein
MKCGWYRTTGTSTFQCYHPSILIQPSSPCCLLPSQLMELSSELERFSGSDSDYRQHLAHINVTSLHVATCGDVGLRAYGGNVGF